MSGAVKDASALHKETLRFASEHQKAKAPLSVPQKEGVLRVAPPSRMIVIATSAEELGESPADAPAAPAYGGCPERQSRPMHPRMPLAMHRKELPPAVEPPRRAAGSERRGRGRPSNDNKQACLNRVEGREENRPRLRGDKGGR